MTHTMLAASLDGVARVVGQGSADFEEARARLDILRRVEHPGLWLPDRVELESNGDVVARGPRASGVDLASLVRIRGGLEAGECVAVGIDVAGALAALHAIGEVHGDLSPANVIVTPTRAVLIDLIGGSGRRERGTPGFSAPERPVAATPASDVYSLGRLLYSLAADDARERIEAWTAPLTAPAPNLRPPADEVAVAFQRCATPVPVAVPEIGVAAAIRARALSADEATIKTPAGRPWRVRRALTRSALATGVVGVGIGVLWSLVALVGALVPNPAPTYQQTLPIPAEWVAAAPEDAASALTVGRFEAIEAGDAEGLLATTAEGSEARTADENLAAGLASGAIRFEGLGVEVASATVVEAHGNSAIVRVAYLVAAHETWDGSLGGEVGEETASAELHIVWTHESGWRVEYARALS